MVLVTLLFFASARDCVGVAERRDLLLPESAWSSAADLLDHLCSQEFPALLPLRSSLALAINETYCTASDPILLKDSDRLAIIPPITGG